MSWEDYQKRIFLYQKSILREICYKLSLKKAFSEIKTLIESAVPDPPNDQGHLSMRRQHVLQLLPRLHTLLNSAKEDDFSPEPVIGLMDELYNESMLSGTSAGAWQRNLESLEMLRTGFMMIRNLIKYSQLKEFSEINLAVEEDGFHLSQALARVASYCLNAYREEKDKERYLDFQDLQLKVLNLIKSPKYRHILNELRQNYLYIMVDEFQDTNSLQWEIVRLIASDLEEQLMGNRLFIVGDEKQAIYSFRGGDVSLFAKVKRELVSTNQERGTNQIPFLLDATAEIGKDYQPEYSQKLADDHAIKAGEVIFSDNFRSAAKPITFFNLFFDALLGQEFYEDHEARPQRLICSGNKRDGSVELLLVKPEDKTDDALQISEQLEEIDLHVKEAHLIAAKIKEVLTGDDPAYENVREQVIEKKPAIAILLNRRTKLKIYEEALRRENIDFIVVRGRGFFQRQEIVDLGNLLGFLIEPGNSIYLAGFLRSPIGHVPDEIIYLLSRMPVGETLWEKLCRLMTQNESNPDFPPAEFENLKRCYQLLTRWQILSRRLVLVQFLRLVLEEGGYFASLARGNRGEQAISNIEKLLDRAREATLSSQEDLLTFVYWLNERIDYVEEEGEADVDIVLGGAVQLMTVHQSKGLEFPMVFVPDLNAYFNFGERETLHFDEVTASFSFANDGSLLRKTHFEIGLDLPDPEKNYDPTPTLIKKIIERRNHEKVIAERKRLFYVAATRAMDHLVLVGQLKERSMRSIQEFVVADLNQLNNWMDWLVKIMDLSKKVEAQRGEILFGHPNREHIRIPYRLFDENQSVLSFNEQWRTEFPI
ncbi:UvrD-helicase domain-containing protein [candidate division KSB1 bacterium]|nr:UvrD-helicase domain-containing protein [candidate division KSB1 bacterium]